MRLVFALVVGVALTITGAGPASAVPRPPGHQQAVDFVISRALAQRGVPYAYGGGDASGPTRRPVSVPPPVDGAAVTNLGLIPAPGALAPDPTANVVGFDASGLIVYAFAGVGFTLPRSSGEQYRVGWKVTPAQALPGDLIFYGPDGTRSVALFLGNGQMLEATEPAVTVSPVRTTGMAPYLGRIIS